MSHARLHTLELCAGYGGLGMGVKLARPDARVVAMVEREAACVEVLASRMEEGHLDQAPIFSDVCSFDGRPWARAVDLITAGIPCQPWSVAGKQRGHDDERHLGEELVRIVGEVGPRFVFVENVRGFVRLGAPDLLGRLADLGFDAEWGLFSSAGVGAPHRRERIFLLAYSRNQRGRCPRGATALQGRGSAEAGGKGLQDQGRQNHQPDAHPGYAGREDVAYRNGGGLESLGLGGLLDGERTALGHDLDGRAEGLADAGHGLPQGVEPGWAAPGATRRGGGAEVAFPFASPPGPSGDWSGIDPRLHPAIESDLRRVADGSPGRVDRLRMLGNGVDPLVAAHAWMSLFDRHGLTTEDTK